MYFLTVPKSSMLMLYRVASFLTAETSVRICLISETWVAVAGIKGAGMTLTDVTGRVVSVDYVEGICC